MKALKGISRGNQILLAALLVQIILIAVVFWPRAGSATATAQDTPLFQGVTADRITRLAIRDAEGGEVALEKKNGAWVLPAADDYPCEASRVSDFLQKLAGLKADRLVTETEQSHGRLKVADDDYERMITFTLDDGTGYTLFLGTAPTYQVSHVRVAGQNEVYLVSGFGITDASSAPMAWVNIEYVSIPQDRIEKLTIQNDKGTLIFHRGEDGTWQMEGLAEDEKLDQNLVLAMVGRLESWPMTEPLGKEAKPEYGMDDPSAVVTIEAKDDAGQAKTYTLTIGAKDADNSYVARFSKSDYYVRVSDYSAQDFVEKGHQDFLRLPPTPTPENILQGALTPAP